MSKARRAVLLATVVNKLVQDVQRRLDASASSATKAWFTNYVKGTEWRGNKVPATRAAVRDAIRDADEGSTPTVAQEAGLQLLKSVYCDDKLAGMILLQEHAMRAWEEADAPAHAQALFLQLEALFLDESPAGVSDWSTCDWLCMRVLGPLAALSPEVKRALLAWSHRGPEASVWMRRAGHVSFVKWVTAQAATKGRKRARGDEGGEAPWAHVFGPEFLDELVAAADAALAFEERFAQTGAGWVLRYTLLWDEQRTAGVLRRRGPTMSREGMRYALEKRANKALRDELTAVCAKNRAQ